ncbi:MAG: hypothetical protein COZ16_05595 [Flavobacteriaceae bacterium CG_4_10_14_3_um_filter_31_253]|nr:MAG: hypothetical protein COZ16_05595 [Flavobacteriaceae bacterium CG_4_10_14_3_um_filter_31_253]
MKKDILYTSNTCEPIIFNGDFDIGDSEKQEIETICFSQKGDFREYPLCGVGLRTSQNAPLNAEFLREIRLQLERDKIFPKKISIVDNNIKIE